MTWRLADHNMDRITPWRVLNHQVRSVVKLYGNSWATIKRFTEIPGTFAVVWVWTTGWPVGARKDGKVKVCCVADMAFHWEKIANNGHKKLWSETIFEQVLRYNIRENKFITSFQTLRSFYPNRAAIVVSILKDSWYTHLFSFQNSVFKKLG